MIKSCILDVKFSVCGLSITINLTFLSRELGVGPKTNISVHVRQELLALQKNNDVKERVIEVYLCRKWKKARKKLNCIVCCIPGL